MPSCSLPSNPSPLPWSPCIYERFFQWSRQQQRENASLLARRNSTAIFRRTNGVPPDDIRFKREWNLLMVIVRLPFLSSFASEGRVLNEIISDGLERRFGLTFYSLPIFFFFSEFSQRNDFIASVRVVTRIKLFITNTGYIQNLLTYFGVIV